MPPASIAFFTSSIAVSAVRVSADVYRRCPLSPTRILSIEPSAFLISARHPSWREGRVHQTLSRFEAAHTPPQLGGFLTNKIHFCAAAEIIGCEFAPNAVLQTSDAKEAALAATLAGTPHAILDHEPVIVPAGAVQCSAQSSRTHCQDRS